MSFNIEVRKKQLHSLNQYISSSKDKVESILDYLGWSGKKILESTEKTNCPIDTKHKVPIEKIEKHVQKCCLVSSGYDVNEQFLSEPQGSSSTSITLDVPKKIEILNEARQLNLKFRPAWNGLDPDPLTSDRIMTTFSPDERLAIYSYCVKNTEAPPVPPEFLINEESTSKKEEVLTEGQRLERERDAKRRPVKYKSVHTGRNKSHTEVMKEVIHNQMELFQEHLKEKQRLKEEAESKKEKELLEKAQSYEQFPHIDTNVVYDYGLDLFDASEPDFFDKNLNDNISFNVNYDYSAEVPVKIEQDHCENKTEMSNLIDMEKSDKRDDHKLRNGHRELHKRQRSRDRERDYKRNYERSRERREYYHRRKEFHYKSDRRY